ncbi:MAG: hypothetical protein NWF10_06705 [Candidatus Bathyarchaeota archaeon]|jgi:uncharacterized coiled-coil protein SlyX|nr:hypothetical protein [Candidatus Bathyarchaeota archaeon]
MSIESDKLKVLVDFKKRLENKISELESELQEKKVTLEALNSILIEKGFKRGDMKSVRLSKELETPRKITVSTTKPESPVFHSKETESVIPLKTKTGESLAIIYVNKQVLHVLPDETKNFNINTPPFDSFLVERVLMKMRQKDENLVKTGELILEKMFAYEIITEGEMLREIVVRNADGERLKELKSSIRWTLEKMYEKRKK